MITFLNGVLVHSLPHQATIDVGGVGYLVWIPLSTYDALPQPGGKVRLLTHHHMTEREQSLFGFASDAERDLFRLLINQVSGVGPKVALAVLSGLPVDAFKQAVVAQDVKQLSRIKGIGAKTAERLVFELRDKVGVAEAWQIQQQTAAGQPVAGSAMEMDAVLALIALGYKQADALKAVQATRREAAEPVVNANELLRAALRRLGS